jgi:NADH dehydrogenase
MCHVGRRIWEGRSRVVVIGAGFGGLAVREALAKTDVDIVLIDRHNYNTFQS